MILYLDTNIVIYTVEHHPTFGPKVRNRLGLARAAGDTLMVSDLTRMECLVGPLKSGNSAGIKDFETFFGVTKVVAITAAVCDRAASIRATMRFKQMDSLQLAAAVEHGADVFFTNDGRLNSFTGVKVEPL